MCVHIYGHMVFVVCSKNIYISRDLPDHAGGQQEIRVECEPDGDPRAAEPSSSNGEPKPAPGAVHLSSGSHASHVGSYRPVTNNKITHPLLITPPSVIINLFTSFK